MKSMIVAGGALMVAMVLAQPQGPADARGGVNASYARAYCEYYRTKAMVVARRQHQGGLASSDGAHERGDAEYWRQKYRACLKEHGY